MFDSSPTRSGPLPIWPYYFTAVVSAVAGLAMVWIWSPEYVPAKADLVEISGDIASVRIKDDFSGTSAGALLTGFTSVYFTFDNHDGQYFYPSTQPDFRLVRDYTAVNIDVLIERSKIGGTEPFRIWQIKENNPNNMLEIATYVPYEAIITRLSTIGSSMVNTGRWLLVLAGGLILFGRAMQIRNKRRFSRL